MRPGCSRAGPAPDARIGGDTAPNPCSSSLSCLSSSRGALNSQGTTHACPSTAAPLSLPLLQPKWCTLQHGSRSCMAARAGQARQALPSTLNAWWQQQSARRLPGRPGFQRLQSAPAPACCTQPATGPRPQSPVPGSRPARAGPLPRRRRGRTRPAQLRGPRPAPVAARICAGGVELSRVEGGFDAGTGVWIDAVGDDGLLMQQCSSHRHARSGMERMPLPWRAGDPRGSTHPEARIRRSLTSRLRLAGRPSPGSGCRAGC